LYALSVTWGAIAAKMVDSEERPSTRRNFINSWLAETYEHVERDTDWEALGKRLMIYPLERGQIPNWCRWLVAGVDKQESHYPVVAEAWGEDGRCHTVDHAKLETDDELLEWLAGEFPGPDGQLLRLSLVLMDFGYRPHGVHDLVARARERGITMIPCKGSSKSLGTPYQRRKLGKDTSKPGARFILVDTISSQDWIDQQLHDIVPGTAGGMSLFRAPLGEQQEFLQQILNDAPVQANDKHNQVRESWDRIDPNIPNDFRDAKRLSATAMLVRKNGHVGQWNDLPTGGWFKAQERQRGRGGERERGRS
jgi:phage terminase large subunit GpA-like protein